MARKTLPKNLFRNYRADIKFNEAEWKKLNELANEEEMTVPSFVRILITKWYRMKNTPNKQGELPTLIQ
jgi:hypothetical protein